MNSKGNYVVAAAVVNQSIDIRGDDVVCGNFSGLKLVLSFDGLVL